MKKITFLLFAIMVLCNTTMLRAQESMMDYGTPLMKATVSDDDFDEVVRLVTNGADILEEDKYGNNAIDWANYFGSEKISNYLTRVLMVYMFYNEIVPLEIGKYDGGAKHKNISCNNYSYTLTKMRLNNGILVGVVLNSLQNGKRRMVYSVERDVFNMVVEAIYKGKLEGIEDYHSGDSFDFLMGFENDNKSFEILWEIPLNEWDKYQKDNDYNFKCNQLFSFHDIDLYEQWKKEGHLYN